MAAANPVRGEVRFETDDGRQFRGVFDIDAICALEDLRDRSVIQILGQVLNGRIGFVRDALWCALRKHHDELTRDEVGELVMLVKGPGPAKIVADALQAAFPAPKGKGGDDGKDPPLA